LARDFGGRRWKRIRSRRWRKNEETTLIRRRKIRTKTKVAVIEESE